MAVKEPGASPDDQICATNHSCPTSINMSFQLPAMSTMYIQTLRGRGKREYRYRMEVTEPPVTENFSLSGFVLKIMESIFEATLNIAESLKLSFPRVDDLGRLVTEAAHGQSQAVLHI